jgi:hypothetical protein
MEKKERVEVTLSNNITVHVKNGIRSVTLRKKRMIKLDRGTDYITKRKKIRSTF